MINKKENQCHNNNNDMHKLLGEVNLCKNNFFHRLYNYAYYDNIFPSFDATTKNIFSLFFFYTYTYIMYIGCNIDSYPPF